MHAPALDVKAALENLPSINVASVSTTRNGWRITFESEAGDLPLMQVTTGRITGFAHISVSVEEVAKGTAAKLLFDGSDQPDNCIFTATELTTDAGYAFKVAPVNAIGDGALSAVSITAIPSTRAAASQTTASGSALIAGIAGTVAEEQLVVFVTEDCDSNQLVLSLGNSGQTENLCGSSASLFEESIEKLGNVGDVHVTREPITSLAGLQGFAWTVTFFSLKGDVPTLKVDIQLVNQGRDWSDRTGLEAAYVSEFMKGRANEFIIEPKKASGTPLMSFDEIQGVDTFYTELWLPDELKSDGSHLWHSDGGSAVYNRIQYEVQTLSVQKGSSPFTITMDTSGMIGGISLSTKDLPGGNVTSREIKDALEDLDKVGSIQISSLPLSDSTKFFITFMSEFGERLLLYTSSDSVSVSRDGGSYGVTEVQTITLVSDKAFIYGVQSISIPRSSRNFTLTYGSSTTNSIACNFANVSDALILITVLKRELESFSDIEVVVDSFISGSGSDNGPWIFKVTFIKPVGRLPSITSDKAIITEIQQGSSNLHRTFVLSYMSEFTGSIPFDADAQVMKKHLEALANCYSVFDVLALSFVIGTYSVRPVLFFSR